MNGPPSLASVQMCFRPIRFPLKLWYSECALPDYQHRHHLEHCREGTSLSPILNQEVQKHWWWTQEFQGPHVISSWSFRRSSSVASKKRRYLSVCVRFRLLSLPTQTVHTHLLHCFQTTIIEILLLRWQGKNTSYVYCGDACIDRGTSSSLRQNWARKFFGREASVNFMSS